MPTVSIRVNALRLAGDIRDAGWDPAELARRARVADMTVYRLLGGRRVARRTAVKLARALGRPIERYLDVEQAIA